MMAVRTRKNQYRGVNAHLHSLWQNEGGWNNFHNRHIGDLAGLLIHQLLPLGYVVTMEESLQVRHLDSDDGSRRPQSDILIGDVQSTQRSASGVAEAVAAEYRLMEWLAPRTVEKPYRALRIDTRAGVGEPVAWVELLSPSNKRYSHDRGDYLYKRNLLLKNGIVIVEIDYLHETPTTFDRHVADYSRLNERDHAHPYRMMTLDPRPTMEDGRVYPYPYAVDQPIPTVTIPLNGDDKIAFDFGAAYTKTFTEMSYGLIYVDYAAYPLHFDSYSAADQARIANRMLAVLDARAAGVDLEADAPLDVEALPLDIARERIAALPTSTV